MIIETEPLIPSLIHLSKSSPYLANIYLFWFNNRNTGNRFKICSKLFLTLNRFRTLFWCLHCWFWKIKKIHTLLWYFYYRIWTSTCRLGWGSLRDFLHFFRGIAKLLEKFVHLEPETKRSNDDGVHLKRFAWFGNIYTILKTWKTLMEEYYF